MKKLSLLLLISISILVIKSRAYAATWIDIPVVNPGAEVGETSGWAVSGLVSAVTSQWQSGMTAYPHAGNWFFTCAAAASNYGNLTQQIILSSFTNEIDAGETKYNFSFWYQNEYWYDSNHPDTAEGIINFYDAFHVQLYSYSTGDISSQDVWALLTHEDFIPQGSRIAEISLRGYLHDGGAVNTHFDDISLKIGTSNPVPEPATLSLLGLGLLGVLLRKRK